MKKLIFILLTFILNFNLFATHIYDNTNNLILYENIMSIVSKDLNLDTCNINIIISYSTFDDQYDNHNNYLASTRKIDCNTYSINITKCYNKKDEIISFIHELVHIQQIQQKRMVILSRSVWYDNVTYTNKDVFEIRNYETEAIKIANDLYFKNKKLFKLL